MPEEILLEEDFRKKDRDSYEEGRIREAEN